MNRKLQFVIWGVDATHSWHWELRSSNGTVLARSPANGFKSRAAAIKSVERLQDNTESSTIYVNGKELT